jgi:tetratricopeptide (TPR) repeat protein
MARYLSGDRNSAVADAEQALRLDPGHEAARRIRAQALGELVTERIQQGTAYGQRGDHDRALAEFNEAVRIGPDRADAYANRGMAYYYKGDFDRAIADLEQALRLAPGNEQIRSSLEKIRYWRDQGY